MPLRTMSRIRYSTPHVGAVLALVALLAGCTTVGPDYRRPDAPTTKTYTDESLDAVGAGGQQLVSGQNPAADWWKLFGSNALNDTVQQALADNRSLASAQASMAVAREAVNASVGALYPQLNLNGGVGREKYGAEFSGPIFFPPFTYYAVGVNVSYLFDYTGGQQRAVEQKQAQAEYQAYELQAAYLSLTGNVVQQALASASARAQLDALDKLIEEDKKDVALVQNAFDAGSVSRVDTLTARSHLSSDQTLIPPLRQQLSISRHALSILVGRAPADWQPPKFALEEFQLPATLPLSLPSELVHQRPDILAAEARLHAATAAVGVATSRLYPQINLTASAGPQSPELSQLFNRSNEAWALAAGLTAPLFDGGTLRAQRRAAQEEMKAALANYQQTVLQSFGQVADVLTALANDADQITTQKNAVDHAMVNLDLTRESYKAGNVGVLQIIDAERLYQQVQLGYVRAVAQRYSDTAELLMALGGSPIGEAAK